MLIVIACLLVILAFPPTRALLGLLLFAALCGALGIGGVLLFIGLSQYIVTHWLTN